MNFLIWFINVLIISCLLLIRWRQSRKNLYKCASMLPGLDGYPLLGVIPYIIGKQGEEIFSTILEKLKPFGTLVKAWMGPVLMIVVENPDSLKEILNSEKCLKKAFAYEFLNVNMGLMAATQGFPLLGVLPRFYGKTNEEILFEVLDIANSYENLARLWLGNKLVLILLGLDYVKIVLNSQKCLDKAFAYEFLGVDLGLISAKKNADILAETINKRIFNIFYHPIQIYKFTKSHLIESKAWAGLRTVSSRVIENAEKTYMKPVPNELNVKSELRKPCVFVEQVYKLFQYTKEFDEQMVKDEIDTLIAGGNETSGMTTSFCILMMAMHPEIQERVIEEMRSVFESVDEPVTQDHLSQLNYLTMVLNETLRLFPITPFIGREVQEDIQLDEYTLPKGASLVIPIFKIHRQEAIWGPEAHLFNPDNFLPENVATRHPYAWIPFSAGQRNCIGMKYSLIAMKVMLCYLLRNYKFSTSLKYSELKFKMALDLKIVNRHMVSIERRNF
uniref:CSON006028 protein n=1 Tax=Culicoides sonorensis TaxID=179676 RepID=A0A336LJB5_CULSO